MGSTRTVEGRRRGVLLLAAALVAVAACGDDDKKTASNIVDEVVSTSPATESVDEEPNDEESDETESSSESADDESTGGDGSSDEAAGAAFEEAPDEGDQPTAPGSPAVANEVDSIDLERRHQQFRDLISGAQVAVPGPFGAFTGSPVLPRDSGMDLIMVARGEVATDTIATLSQAAAESGGLISPFNETFHQYEETVEIFLLLVKFGSIPDIWGFTLSADMGGEHTIEPGTGIPVHIEGVSTWFETTLLADGEVFDDFMGVADGGSDFLRYSNPIVVIDCGVDWLTDFDFDTGTEPFGPATSALYMLSGPSEATELNVFWLDGFDALDAVVQTIPLDEGDNPLEDGNETFETPGIDVPIAPGELCPGIGGSVTPKLSLKQRYLIDWDALPGSD